MIILPFVNTHFMSFHWCTILHVDNVSRYLTCSCIHMLITSFPIVLPHVICLALSHMPMHLYYIHRFSHMPTHLYYIHRLSHVPYSMLLLPSHIISLYSWLLHALIYCLYGKGLLNNCYCQINPKVIQMKDNHKAEWSWVPNTFPRTYLSSRPSLRLVPLFMKSKLVPGPKNQVVTPFLCPSPQD